jgi:hypothetical protein
MGMGIDLSSEVPRDPITNQTPSLVTNTRDNKEEKKLNYTRAIKNKLLQMHLRVHQFNNRNCRTHWQELRKYFAIFQCLYSICGRKQGTVKY